MQSAALGALFPAHANHQTQISGFNRQMRGRNSSGQPVRRWGITPVGGCLTQTTHHIGHVLIMRAVCYWSPLFLSLWVPTVAFIAYRFMGVSIVEGTPSWMSMALLQLLALVIVAAVAADIIVRIRPVRLSILYLRKFHAEPREAFPVNPFDPTSGLPPDSPLRTQDFRLASMIEGVGLLGIRVIALRDARTPGSGHVISYLLPAYFLLMLLARPFVALFAFSAVTIATSSALGVGAQDWDFVAFVCFVLLGTIALTWPAAGQWVRTAMEEHIEWVRGVLIPGRFPKNVGQLDKIIERARSMGPVAVKSTDANWVVFVSRLIDVADVVLFDIRSSSANCEVELQLIRDKRAHGRVLWFVSDEAQVQIESDHYRVEGTMFSGKAELFSVPLQQPPSAWWHPINRAHVEFVANLSHRLGIVAVRSAQQ